ncbi:Ig-like domain-containing protein [Desulfosarcina cetonica]|uniref:Ig-like domain-containing protein n=1 Tax=Desulfosarcina cetonica TaxID=90730 RepID=UPI0006CF40BD|nr:Ig-like domain-containing protein [Desulfosarcina cetonica]
MAGNQAFADGYTLTGTVTLSLSASDPSGVSRVEFSLDGTLLRTDYSAPYTCYLDPADMADGSHTLIITAYDTLDNRTTLTINFTVALALPDAPVISSPTDGTTTNKTQVVVSGQALADTTVKLYVNGLSGGASGTADGKGYFSIILTLAEGANSIQASAANRSGEGPLSIAVTVTLDTTLPSAPTAVTATAKSGGVIRIGWQKPSDSVISGYNLYRSAAGFTDVAQAQRVNASTLTSDSFEDVPGSDGTWYYRVTCLDAAGNESEPSSQVFAVADSIAPRAVSIVYTPEGAHDTDTGTMAPGTVNLVLTVSEALQATPFLSITPSGATPISVDLTQIDDTTYGGFFVIADTTPSGNAWAVFSGRDMVGNRGTEIDAGGTILIDTDGPSVHRLVVTPQSPIQNDVEEPVTVTAVLGLSEAVKAGTLPEVGYLLSGDGRETVTVDSLAQLATADGDAQTWQAVFSLPADAGAADAESLSLTFSAFDDLDNAGSDIDADNRFQVYQGDLPPLEAPDGLTGRALPGGKVQLSWNPVDQAVAYQVYRQGPDETELAVLTRLDDGSLIEHVDATETDGDYTYAVTSIRAENGQEAESGLSDTVTVAADSVAPNAPTDFALELVANGIKASWNPPAYTEAITYSLYRAPQTEITTVDGLDALAEGIEATLVVDPHPSDDDHCYTVTAVDAAGNQSPPATSSYLNFDLLPVSSLSVVQSESESPVVSWTHSGSTIAGYRIYLGDVDAGVQLSDGLLTDTQYTDIGWSDDQRQYTVVAVDADDVASLGRGITLPVIEASLVDDAWCAGA